MSINDQIDFKDRLANPDLRFALYRLPAGPRPALAPTSPGRQTVSLWGLALCLLVA